MATPNRSSTSGTPVTGQSVTARTGTLGTVHHLAPGGIVRTTNTPFANLQQGILAMSMQSQQQKSSASQGSATFPKFGSPSGGLTTKLVTSPVPRKKIKLEEVPAPNSEIATARQKILDEKLEQMKAIKESYMDHLTECFFLQRGGQLMDYFAWRKRPTPELLEFLRSGRLDSDDEDENPLQYLEKKTDETKSVGSSCPTVTPVATSTTLPASVAALSQHGSSSLSSNLLSTSSGGLHKSVSDSKLVSLAQSTKVVMSTQASVSLKKSPPASPGRHKQGASDGTNIKGISSQEAIVERAKQEAQVMSRVAELRKDGLWSSRRLPKVQEPPRTKAHWDYLLEEMQWLAADFQQERKWKKTAARKLAKMVQKHFFSQDVIRHAANSDLLRLILPRFYIRKCILNELLKPIEDYKRIHH